MRRIWVFACLVLAAAACGGESLTLSEYAAQGQAVVTVMEERIAALDDDWEAQSPTVERAQTYWDRRLRARVEALEGLQALDPPAAVAELHETGVPLYGRLIAAEEALAARVASFQSATGPEQWWSTAEGEAVRVVDEEINDFCLIFQARYDATVERISLSDVSWIPAEMKEVVRIDIGCRQ